jgi:hypothetical protein
VYKLIAYIDPKRSDNTDGIYHVQNNLKYVGYTTNLPTGCKGTTNHITGFCSLLFQRVEESFTMITTSNTFNTNIAEDSDDSSFTGRCVLPKIVSNIYEYKEVYGFYNNVTNLLSNRLNTTIIDEDFVIDNNWYLGTVRYRSVLNTILVADKVFGTPVTLQLRSIGNYQALLGSLNTVIVSNNITNEVEDVIISDNLDYSPLSGILTSTGDVKLVSEGFTGSIVTNGSTNLYSESVIMVSKGNNSQLTVDLSLLTSTNVVTAISGNLQITFNL